MVFVFLTYFPQCDNLQVCPCCSRWHCFILFYGQVPFSCVCRESDKVETRRTVVQGLMLKEPYFCLTSLPLCFSRWVSSNGQTGSGKEEAERSLPTPPLRGRSGGQSVSSRGSSGLLVSGRFSLPLSSCCWFVGSGGAQWQWLHFTRVSTCLWVAVT